MIEANEYLGAGFKHVHYSLIVEETQVFTLKLKQVKEFRTFCKLRHHVTAGE